MFTIEQAARMYSIPLIDYHRGSGVLIGSGAGTMMAVMDQALELRWCVDVDSFDKRSRLADFLLMAERVVSPIVVAGWFSITDPAPIRRAIAGLRTPPVCYGGNVRLTTDPTEATSMQELLDQLEDRRERTARRRAIVAL